MFLFSIFYLFDPFLLYNFLLIVYLLSLYLFPILFVLFQSFSYVCYDCDRKTIEPAVQVRKNDTFCQSKYFIIFSKYSLLYFNKLKINYYAILIE